MCEAAVGDLLMPYQNPYRGGFSSLGLGRALWIDPHTTLVPIRAPQTKVPEPTDSNWNFHKSGALNFKLPGISTIKSLGGVSNIVKESVIWTHNRMKSILGIHCPIPQPPLATPRDVFLCCRRLVDKQAVYRPINVINSHDQQFFRLIKRAYRSLRGGFGWISLREVARFRFVKFQRFYQIHVSCSEREQLPQRDHLEYEIDYPPSYQPNSLPFEPPIHPDIMIYFYNNPGCADAKEKFLKFIPKRIVNNPNPPDEAWGLYAEEGLCMWKFLTIFLAILIFSIMFISVWLVYHPGDLQNAFTPPGFIFTVVGVLMVAPEFVGYSSKQKRV
ncbi:hypothetical protein TWF506_002420 [Arthrobotrys conoides]|uniref:Uncharacterized protein n=1 Tax=Arthrobotrys conoides TaxID=74498 RepID=A0AAN8N4E7_9PEZI